MREAAYADVSALSRTQAGYSEKLDISPLFETSYGWSMVNK